MISSAPRRDGSQRVLIHVQHLMGIGHLRRALSIATAVVRNGMRCTVLSGGMPVPGIAEEAKDANVDFVQLPAMRSADLSYKSMLDENGREVSAALFAKREAIIADVLERFRHDAVITESYPFGRRSLRGEVLGLIARARELNPKVFVATSIRDILEGFETAGERVDTVVDVLDAHYDAVLVHSDARVIKLDATFPFVERLTVPLHYTGFVDQHPTMTPPTLELPTGEVIVSTGGGVVGAELIELALNARALSRELSACPWRVLVGHNLPDRVFEALRGRAPPGVIIERNREDFRHLLSRSTLSVSQVGYNTALDILASGVKAVLVPFRSDTQREQTIRARVFADARLGVMVERHERSPEGLARAMETACHLEAPRLDWMLDGARVTASFIGRQIQV